MTKLIKKTSLFQGLDEESLQDFAQHCHPKHFTKGREIFAMGDAAETLFVVQSGWVKLYRASKGGEETIINIFGPGESFAEAAVFGENKVYPVNAQALEDTSLIEIHRSFFIQKIENDSRFALAMLGAIASRQYYLVQQLEQVTTRSAPQRIGAFLLRFCHPQQKEQGKHIWSVDLPYDKSIISTRLNIKPETFSRALAKLGPHGVIINKRKIIITDKERLMEFCDVPLLEKPCRTR